MTQTNPVCLVCEASEHDLPLIHLRYQGQEYWICAQHLPILIHQPARLAGKLPGAERFQGAQHDHD